MTFLIDVSKASEIIGISVRHLRRFVASGQLNVVKFGKVDKFKRPEVEAFAKTFSKGNTESGKAKRAETRDRNRGACAI